MLKNLAAAVLAVSLIAGPAFAQGNAPAAQPAAKTAVTTGVKVKETGTVAPKTVKHVSLRHRHHIRHFAHVKHVKHVVHAKHIKHLKQVKRVNPAKIKVNG